MRLLKSSLHAVKSMFLAMTLRLSVFANFVQGRKGKADRQLRQGLDLIGRRIPSSHVGLWAGLVWQVIHSLLLAAHLPQLLARGWCLVKRESHDVTAISPRARCAYYAAGVYCRLAALVRLGKQHYFFCFEELQETFLLYRLKHHVWGIFWRQRPVSAVW